VVKLDWGGGGRGLAHGDLVAFAQPGALATASDAAEVARFVVEL
jgi:hypothetical protein